MNPIMAQYLRPGAGPKMARNSSRVISSKDLAYDDKLKNKFINKRTKILDRNPSWFSKTSSRRSHRSSSRVMIIDENKNQGLPRKPNTFFKYDERHFKKMPSNPQLFSLDLDQRDYAHLLKDDLDKASKIEVVYKILKDQLRAYQKQLLKLRQDKKLDHERKKMAKVHSKNPKQLSQKELDDFAKYLKHFEKNADQRDMNPELKRIVENLSCKEHKFMYCPCCQDYLERDFDPVENIRKFMLFVKEEKAKLLFERRRQEALRDRDNSKKRPSKKKLADDSVSEITDLEKDEIMEKYAPLMFSEAELKNRERKKVWDRL